MISDGIRETPAPAWQPVSSTPNRPMTVIFYSITRSWYGNEGEKIAAPWPDYRDEKADIGYWNGTEWRWQGTGHLVWEWPEHEGDPDLPTHWMRLQPPASP